MVFMVPEDSTEYWVDNWVIPAASEHPVAAHKWINSVLDPARRQGDELPPVRRAGEDISGVPEDLAKNPIIAIPNEAIERYETQLQTPKGQQQRDRAYTEFKAA